MLKPTISDAGPVHVAVEAKDPARPERTALDAGFIAGLRLGEAWLWVAMLLVCVGLSLADGLLGDTVAYERDTTVFYFPLMRWLGQQLQQGVLPLWTPQFFGGYPIFADGEIGLAYPPVLLSLLVMPADRAFILLRFLHLSIAAVGMFVLARTWRLPHPSAALAGIVFALGNFLQAQIHHENIVRTASWLPLTLAWVELALRSRTWQTRLRWTALAAASLGMAGLSLHTQMLAIDLLVLAGYGAMRWAVGELTVQRWTLRPVWLGRFVQVASVEIPVVVVGLGVAAVQLVPLLELAGFSARGSGIPYSESAAYSLTPLGLLQVVFPYVFRGPGNLQWGLWTHWESYLYLGLAPLVLAIVALVCVRAREVAGWAIIGGLGLILSLGQYSPIDLHYLLWLVPGLSSLRAPGRFTFVVILAGAMLAAYGLAWLIDSSGTGESSRRRIRWLLVLLSGAAGMLALLVLAGHTALLTWPDDARSFVQSAYLSLPRDSYPLTENDVLTGLLWSSDLGNPRVAGALLGLAAVLAVLWLWQTLRWTAWRGWPSLLVLMSAGDLLLFGWAIHPREPFSKIGAEPPSIQAIEQLPSPDAAPNRVLASPVLNQVAADRLAPFGVQEANGYSSLQFIWHRDYLSRVLYDDDGLLDLWNVRYILDPARFGALASFGEVNYLPQQTLLHAPAGSALAEQRFALSGSPIVELRFITALQAAVDVPQDARVAQVELRDSSGRVVGTAELLAGRDTMEWAWDDPSVQPYVKHQPVLSAGVVQEGSGLQQRTRNLSFADLVFDAPIAGAQSIVVRASPPVGEFALYGAAAVGPDGSLQQLFGKTKTKYREVYVDNEIRVLEDTAAFPRAFMVPRARVAPSLGTALNLMVHQPFHPDQEVILADDSTTQATVQTPDRSGHGTASVIGYAPDRVGVHTSATGDAWLVLSDTYYPGWSASIDGQPATVLRGDVLFRVVGVPAGEHDVEFRFEPASVTLGLAMSAVSLLIVLGVLAFAGRRGVRTSRSGVSHGPGRTT